MATSHLDGPATRNLDHPVFRVARSSSLLSHSHIAAGDAALPNAGNRFDVYGGGVLYLASDVRGCYVETLARFRPTAKIRAMVERENGFMVCGGVPADWRNNRMIACVECPTALPFVDVEAAQTHEFLTAAMARELSALGVDTLDVGLIRGRNRLITRAIASWAYAAVDTSTGAPLYSGIRYVSRLSNYECWAVFDGTDVEEAGKRRTINLGDPELVEIESEFGLRVF